MYNPSGIDNIEYVLISSVSHSSISCKDEDLSVTSTVNRHISSTVILSEFNIFCYNDTYDVHYCTSIMHFAKTSRCCPF